jgi:hypothetical protein
MVGGQIPPTPVMIHPSQQRSSLARRNAGTRVTISRGDTTRSFHIRPAATALAFGFVVMLATVYLAGTAYLIYRDDLLGGALARQVGMQHAYEDRIAALRAEIDRVTSRHVVARKGIGDQVAMLLERQALIGERQQDLEAISVSAERAGINVADALAPLPRSRPVIAAGRPANVGTPALAYAAASESGADIITGSLIRGSAHEAQPDIKPLLSAVAGELDDAERLQSETLDALSAAAAARADKLSSALAPLGVAPETVRDPVPPIAPQGGPFIPAGNLHFVESCRCCREA